MTKRESDVIAATLRHHTSGMDYGQYVRLCVALADALAASNARFNRVAFLIECGAS